MILQRVIIKYWSRAVLASLAIQIDCDSNLEKILKHDNFLVIANHVSWLDIVAINALNPVSFVAKSEIKFWPLIKGVVSSYPFKTWQLEKAL